MTKNRATKQKIRKHYRLKRPVTTNEMNAEIAMLKRHADEGTLDDLNMELFCILTTGQHAITI